MSKIDPEEKLRIAILKLLNIRALRIFGVLVYNFKIHMIADWSKYKEADTAFVTMINREYHIFIAKSFVERLSVNQVIFVLIHEILHVLNGHTYRGKGKIPEIFNLAADHVINEALMKDCDPQNKNSEISNRVEPIASACFFPEYADKNYTAEEVYDLLMQNPDIQKFAKQLQEKTKIRVRIKNGSGNGQSNDSQGEDFDIEIEIDENAPDEITINGKKYKIDQDLKSNKSNNKQDGQSDDMLQQKQKVAELLSEIHAVLQNNINPGSLSGSVKQMIDKLIEVEIPWEQLLEKAILSKVVPDKDTREWCRPNKRLRSHGIILPGTGFTKKPQTAIIILDSSGSISDTDLQKFSNIIMQTLMKFDTVRIIKHDVDVYSDETINANQLTDDNLLLSYEGRGGTSHIDAFNLVEKMFVENRNSISLVIALTDFASNVEQIWNDYKWTLYIPLCVCLTEPTTVPEHIDPHPILIKTKK